MLLQIVGESLAYSLLHGACHLRVAQLGLGLALELRLGHLHRDDGREAFAEVFAGNLYLSLLDLLRNLRVLVGVCLQRARQGHAKTCQMGTTLDGVDIVDVGVDVLRVVGIVHNGHLDGYALLLGLQIDDVVDQVGAVAVDVAHELLQSVLGVEGLLLGLAFLVGAQVGQVDGDAGIQVGQLTHAACDDVPLVGGGGEDGGIGPELLAGTRFVGVAHNLHVVERLSLFVFLLVDVAVAEHLREHVARQGVDAADADAVQTARYLVAALVELTAGMQHGHDDLEGRLVHFLVLVDGDASAVVLHGDRVIFVDGYLDVLAVTGHCLVDRVVDGLVHQVVKTFLADVANVHCRALADGLEAFQHLNITR